MGESFLFNWFRKSADQLKAIREKNKDKLTPKQLEQLDKLIEQKENESK